jgi:DNA polymerase V
MAPLFVSTVKAGFPSPADDFLEEHLDLNKYLVPHPEATFFVRVSGDSMLNAGIFPGDILIVDKSLDPFQNQIVVAVIDGEFTVKRFRKEGSKIFLVPENSKYKPIEIRSGDDFTVWGVVTHNIHVC